MLLLEDVEVLLASTLFVTCLWPVSDYFYFLWWLFSFLQIFFVLLYTVKWIYGSQTVVLQQLLVILAAEDPLSADPTLQVPPASRLYEPLLRVQPLLPRLWQQRMSGLWQPAEGNATGFLSLNWLKQTIWWVHLLFVNWMMNAHGMSSNCVLNPP